MMRGLELHDFRRHILLHQRQVDLILYRHAHQTAASSTSIGSSMGPQDENDFTCKNHNARSEFLSNTPYRMIGCNQASKRLAKTARLHLHHRIMYCNIRVPDGT